MDGIANGRYGVRIRDGRGGGEAEAEDCRGADKLLSTKRALEAALHSRRLAAYTVHDAVPTRAVPLLPGRAGVPAGCAPEPDDSSAR